MKNYLLGIVSTLVLLAVTGGAYYLGQKKPTSIHSEVPLTPSPTSKSSPTATPSPTLQAKPDTYVSEQIIAAITVKNTQPIEGYMADTVNVRLESSSCCGIIAKSEAMSQLSYLDPAVGWDFDPSNPTLVNLAATVPD